MKKIYIMIVILIGISLVSITESYANIFSDDSYVMINEVDSFTNVVIFIKFSDEESYTAPYGYYYYDDMFNGVDTISLRDYYLEVSYDKLTIDSYLVHDNSQIIYFVDSHDRSYYEPYDASLNTNGYLDDGKNEREHALLKAAIDYVEANNLIDDSIVLDSNDDGDIDSITFMVSGEDTDWNTLLWPHKWSLFTYYDSYLNEYESNAPTINGVYAYDYTFELLGNSTTYDYIVHSGVLSHETFHLISAPDLYHYYESENIDPIGNWGLMGSTTHVPSHMLGYMKEYYGKWIDSVTEISESGTYQLDPLQDSENNLYRIDLGNSNEYLYIEYRDNAGLYESNLPDSGLIVYRVDFDFYDAGNVYGYYDEFDMGEDEVFIFRPGIPDLTYPITFPVDDDDLIDEDGDIDSAALSANNSYDEMGVGTDIPMFYSSGEEIDITISNVVEHGGYITFDIELPMKIELDIDEELSLNTSLYLIDNPIFEYNISILNLPSEYNVYYTLDGSVPTTSDILYTGGLIPITSSENIVTAAVYDGETFISSISEEFDFVGSIETSHNPYGNNQDISWYLDFKNEINDYNLTFHNQSELEEDFDYVYLIDNGVTTSYTGTSMRFIDLNFTNDNLLINFTSDEYLDEYFGIEINTSLNNSINIDLNGSDYIELNLGDTYIEEGAYLSGEGADLYTILTEGTIDTSIIGIQTITYSLVNLDGEVFEIIYREVNVIDNIAPVITLIGDEYVTVDYLGNYEEQGVSYTDNLNEDLTYTVNRNVNAAILGEIVLEYTVTDSSGNESNTVTRTVNVVDLVKPVLELKQSVDTIFVGDEYIDPSIYMSDNYPSSLDLVVNGSVDTSIEGEYIIEYIVTDISGNESTIKRYVNVVLKDEVKEFICEAGISTFSITDDIVPPVCRVDGVIADISYSNSGVYTSGTYEITYSVILDDILYEKVSYIFIYNNDEILIDYYEFKRRYIL